MRKIYFTLLIVCSGVNIFGQTFNSTTGTIATSTTTCFDVAVSGVGNIDGVSGIESICLDMDIVSIYAIITAIAPDGTYIYLTYENGGYSPFGNACFDMTGTTNVRLSTAPFSGNYLSQESLGVFNSTGINADGVWQICIESGYYSAANFNSGSITFGNNPALSCGVRAADDECSPPMICNVVGYCGTTLPSYTERTVPTGCGYSLDNNSFVKFTASLNIASLTVDIFDCEVSSDPGVQMEVFSGTCGSLTSVYCYPSNPMAPGTYTLNLNGLTIGDEYFMMIDGYAGNVCGYSFTAGSGIATVSINQGDLVNVCPGEDLDLSVTQQGTSNYTWTWDNGLGGPLTGNAITIPSPVPATSVIVSASGICDNITDTIEVSSGFPGSLAVSPTNSRICSGDSIMLDALVTLNDPIVPSCGISVSSCTGSYSTIAVGSNDGSSSTVTPYRGNYEDNRIQMIYSLAELTAAGLTAGNIDHIDFNVTAKASTGSYNNFTIKMGCIGQTTYSSSDYLTGLSTVLSTSYSSVTGWNSHAITPYYWDGISSLAVEVCYDNTNYTSDDAVSYTTTVGNTVVYSFSDGASGCLLSGATQSNQRPQVRFNICSVDPTILTYSWSPATGLSDPNISNPIAKPAVSTTYLVTSSAGNPTCTISDSIRVNVSCCDLSVSATAISQASDCSGNGEISLVVTGSSTYDVFLDGSTTPSLDDIVDGTYTLTNIVAGTYSVQVLNITDVSCDTIFNITIDPSPILIDVSFTLCEDVLGGASDSGVDLSVYDTLVNGNTIDAVLWYDNLWTLVTTPTNLTINDLDVFNVTVDNGTCIDSINVDFSVIGGLVLIDPNDSLCNNGFVSVDLTSYESIIYSGASPVYTWYEDVGLTTPIMNPSDIIVTNALLVYVQVTDGSCTSSTPVSFTVNPLPIATSSNFQVCEDVLGGTSASGIDLSAYDLLVNGNTLDVVVWYDNLWVSIATPNNITIDDLDVFNIIVNNGNCLDSAIVNFSVSATIQLVDPNDVLCEDASGSASVANVDLTAYESTIYSGGFPVYTWYQDVGLTIPITNPTGFTITNPTVVYVQVSDANCENATSVTFTVSPPPVANSASSSGCDNGAGQSVFDLTSLDATVDAGLGNTVSWFYDPAMVNSIDNPATFTSASTTVFASVSDGKCSDTASVYLIVSPLPLANSTTNDFCDNGFGQSVFDLTSLEANVDAGLGNTVSWFFDSDGINAIGTPGTFTSASTTVFAAVFDGNCTNIIPVYLVVNNLPTADFTYLPNSVTSLNTEIEFNNESIDLLNIDSNYWYFGGLGSSSETNPIYTFPEEKGSYDVSLTIRDKNGCIGLSTKTIFIKGESGIYVPNSFTPDNSGRNDVFLPQGFGINEDTYAFYIFNRWGKKLFETNSTLDSWDGSFQNEKLESGVFIWKVEFKDLEGTQKKYTGRVHLLR